MPDIHILTEAELRRAVDLDLDAVDVVEKAFRALAGGGVVMPPILSMEIAEKHGEVDVKSAYVPGLDGFAIKVSPGFFNNPQLGLPSLNGLMVLFDANTGIVRAVLLDNGYLTDVRTAAAGAVAARHLAPEVVETAGVIGTGLQAELQMRALQMVRPFKQLLVWGRDGAKAKEYAARMSGQLNVPVEPCDDRAMLVRESQAVVTTTPSTGALIEADWLHPGLHITAMGSDAAGKNEIAPAAIAAADVFVCDRQSQSAALGELRSAVEAGVVPADRRFAELGEVIAGSRRGREHNDQITICDLTGTGVQDTAIANVAFDACRKAGQGSVIQS